MDTVNVHEDAVWSPLHGIGVKFVFSTLGQTFLGLLPSVRYPGSEELILGPFQGSLACTRIRKGKGVCGTTWDRAESVIVPDVEKFPGHIACSSASKSEIVVPLVRDGVVYAVLDIDSEFLNTFDQTDRRWLEKIAVILDNSKMH